VKQAPFLSVIIPARNAAGILGRALEAVLASNVPRESWELILVDDASTDDTQIVAARYADLVIRLAGNPHGPAYARNRGAEASRGEVLVFVDADVLVHPDALRRFATVFASRPDVSAVFGSYDAAPDDPGVVSQYRNLLHHYVHQMNAGPAETFWSGLGGIRRQVFLDAGMFDEWHYWRPQIEDIELGRRLRRAGHELLLDPDIQGKHLKRWTLKGMVVTDFQHRGVTWMWLLLMEGTGRAPRSLNLRLSEKVCTGLVGLTGLSLLVAPFLRAIWPLGVAAAALGVVVLFNLGLYTFMGRQRGILFGMAVVPLHFGYYVSNVLAVFSGWLAHTVLGEPDPPAEMQALAQIGVKTWPPPPARPRASLWNPPAAPEPGDSGADQGGP
jgi:glycosyltransferase involved in cell wall biosynthesis